MQQREYVLVTFSHFEAKSIKSGTLDKNGWYKFEAYQNNYTCSPSCVKKNKNKQLKVMCPNQKSGTAPLSLVQRLKDNIVLYQNTVLFTKTELLSFVSCIDGYEDFECKTKPHKSTQATSSCNVM